MKSLKYVENGKLEIWEVEKPTPKAGEVLVKVRACGICGSDVHGYLGLTGRRIPPMTMGHEFAAEIVELGEGVTGFCPGDGVVVQPINFCGKCENCLNGQTNYCLNKLFFGVLEETGAMQEYLCVPQKLLYKITNGCSYYKGALAEPYAVAYGCVRKAEDLKDKKVLIIGAGMIGLCVLQLVKLQKPAMIIMSDLDDNRLAKARELGADYSVNPAKEDALKTISDLTGGSMIDVSFECVGVQPTANQSIKALKINGCAMWLGMSQKEMTINMQDVVCSARRVIGSFNYTHKEFGEVVQLICEGKLATDELISDVVSLENAPDAFRRLREEPDKLIKVIIDPSL